MAGELEMEWFRFYSEVVDERKLQALPPALFRTWVNLLCIANKGKPRGHIVGDLGDLAFRLRMPEPEVEASLQRLREEHLIEPDGDGWTPHKWSDRQPGWDDGAARTARHRSKSRDSNVTQHVTGDAEIRREEIEENRGDKKHTRVSYSDEFEEFWSAYPRRVDKGAAFKAWQARLKEGHKPEDMIAAAKNYARAMEHTEMKFRKHPTTFLGPARPFLEWVQGTPEGERGGSQGTKKGSIAERNREILERELKGGT